MDCDIDFEVLMAYLDGELGPIDRGRVAEHIVACEACRDTVNDLRAVSGALTKWTVPEPIGLPTARELLDRAGAARPIVVARPVWRGAALRWAAAAALAVVAVTAAVVVLHTTRQNGPDVASSHSDAANSAPPEQSGQTAPGAPPAQTPSATNPNGPPPSSTTAPAASAANQPEDKSKAGTAEDVTQEKPDEGVGVVGGLAPPTTRPEPAPSAAAPKSTDAAPPPPPMVEAPPEVARNETAASSGAGEAPGSPNRPLARAQNPAEDESAELSIKRADLTIEARDFDAAVSQVTSAAKSAGGSVASGGSAARRDGGRSVTITVTVPVERYEALVAKIKDIGTVKGEMRSSRDMKKSLDALDDRADADRQRERVIDQTKTATIRVTLKEP